MSEAAVLIGIVLIVFGVIIWAAMNDFGRKERTGSARPPRNVNEDADERTR